MDFRREAWLSRVQALFWNVSFVFIEESSVFVRHLMFCFVVDVLDLCVSGFSSFCSVVVC